MIYLIIFILSCIIAILSCSNMRMAMELELGSSKSVKDLKDYAEIKRKIDDGLLLTPDRVTLLLEDFNREIKLWKDKHADVIIRADDIAGKRAAELLELWKKDEEKSIRAAAIKKSQEVIIGKVTEHILPHFPEFKYNPQDVRFLGTPIDYVVFRGLSEGNVEEVVFIEVKTGKTGKLSTRERQVRDVIQDGRVRYEKIHHKS